MIIIKNSLVTPEFDDSIDIARDYCWIIRTRANTIDSSRVSGENTQRTVNGAFLTIWLWQGPNKQTVRCRCWDNQLVIDSSEATGIISQRTSSGIWFFKFHFTSTDRLLLNIVDDRIGVFHAEQTCAKAVKANGINCVLVFVCCWWRIKDAEKNYKISIKKLNIINILRQPIEIANVVENSPIIWSSAHGNDRWLDRWKHDAIQRTGSFLWLKNGIFRK